MWMLRSCAKNLLKRLIISKPWFILRGTLNTIKKERDIYERFTAIIRENSETLRTKVYKTLYRILDPVIYLLRLVDKRPYVTYLRSVTRQLPLSKLKWGFETYLFRNNACKTSKYITKIIVRFARHNNQLAEINTQQSQ